MVDFQPFPKIPRLSREVIVTEKIDGTNASVLVVDMFPTPDERTEYPKDVEPAATPLVGDVWIFAASRTRWITPEDDNYGFAAWVRDNAEQLVTLGPGHHFGEWWGRGIQRNYSQTERHFSLFNVHRWGEGDGSGGPACCRVVPTLYSGPFEEHGVMKGIKQALHRLQTEGSVAAPGFMKPEGVIIYHKQSNALFKKTIDKDEVPKGLKKAA